MNFIPTADVIIIGLGAMGRTAAYPAYVPLIRRTYDLWEDLQREGEARLLLPAGGAMIGPEKGVLVQGALASARTYALTHELLDGPGLRARFCPGRRGDRGGPHPRGIDPASDRTVPAEPVVGQLLVASGRS